MLVGCGWEVLDTLGAVRVEILLVSPPSPTVTIRTPTSQVPHTATTKARMRATFNPALLTLPPPLLRGSITVIYYLIPYWCCCPPEKVLVVIYYLILLPPLYWGHNAAFTVESATYGPTGKIGDIDHHRRKIYLFLKYGKNLQIHIARPGSINCGNWRKLCVAGGVLRHIAVTRAMGNRQWAYGQCFTLPRQHRASRPVSDECRRPPHPSCPASGRSANE